MWKEIKCEKIRTSLFVKKKFLLKHFVLFWLTTIIKISKMKIEKLIRAGNEQKKVEDCKAFSVHIVSDFDR